MGQNIAWVWVSPGKLRPCPAMGCMTSWRTQLAVAVLALSCSPASAQSLGDVARSERERRSRMVHHAPMLTDEDLRRDQILKKTPLESDSALPSPDNSTSVDENVPLGDYARALRRRRIAEPAPAANAVATGPAPEPQPTAAQTVAHEAQPASAAATPGQKTTSLGDLARQVRTEREAARRTRIQKNAAQPNATQPAAQASSNAAQADKAPPAPQTVRRMPGAAASPKLARSTEVHTKPSTQTAPQPPAALEPGAMAGEQSIRVPRGSSLWKLARVYLGAGHLWPALWKANPQVQDPNHIRAGQLLRCPVLDDQNNPSRSAGLRQPSSVGSSPASAAAERSTPKPLGQAQQPSATGSGIQPRARVRKSLFSGPPSR
jgi:hypothetical protein